MIKQRTLLLILLIGLFTLSLVNGSLPGSSNPILGDYFTKSGTTPSLEDPLPSNSSLTTITSGKSPVPIFNNTGDPPEYEYRSNHTLGSFLYKEHLDVGEVFRAESTYKGLDFYYIDEPLDLSWINEIQETDYISSLQPSLGQVTGSTIWYNSSFVSGSFNVDLYYTANDVCAEQGWVLNEKPPAPPSYMLAYPTYLGFEFMYKYSSNLVPYIWGNPAPNSFTANESVWFVDSREDWTDANDDIIFRLEMPIAYDAVGNRTIGTAFLQKQGGKFYWYTRIPFDWLNDSSRVYPITIDPTVIDAATQGDHSVRCFTTFLPDEDADYGVHRWFRVYGSSAGTVSVAYTDVSDLSSGYQLTDFTNTYYYHYGVSSFILDELNDYVYLFYVVRPNTTGYIMYIARSDDRGETWTEEWQNLIDVNEQIAVTNVVIGGDGKWYFCYGRASDDDWRLMWSADQGVTWTEEGVIGAGSEISNGGLLFDDYNDRLLLVGRYATQIMASWYSNDVGVFDDDTDAYGDTAAWTMDYVHTSSGGWVQDVHAIAKTPDDDRIAVVFHSQQGSSTGYRRNVVAGTNNGGDIWTSQVASARPDSYQASGGIQVLEGDTLRCYVNVDTRIRYYDWTTSFGSETTLYDVTYGIRNLHCTDFPNEYNWMALSWVEYSSGDLEMYSWSSTESCSLPVITAVSVTANDTDNLYHMRYYYFDITVTDGDRASRNIEEVWVQFVDGSGNVIQVSYDVDGDAATIQSGSAYIDESGSYDAVSGSYGIKARFRLRLEWDFDDLNDMDLLCAAQYDEGPVPSFNDFWSYAQTNTYNSKWTAWKNGNYDTMDDITVSVSPYDTQVNPSVAFSVVGSLYYTASVGGDNVKVTSDDFDVRCDPDWTTTNYDDNSLPTGDFDITAYSAGSSARGVYTFDVFTVNNPAEYIGTVTADENNPQDVDKIVINTLTISGELLQTDDDYITDFGSNMAIALTATWDSGYDPDPSFTATMSYDGDGSWFTISVTSGAGSDTVSETPALNTLLMRENVIVSSISGGDADTWGTAFGELYTKTYDMGWSNELNCSATIVTYWGETADGNAVGFWEFTTSVTFNLNSSNCGGLRVYYYKNDSLQGFMTIFSDGSVSDIAIYFPVQFKHAVIEFLVKHPSDLNEYYVLLNVTVDPPTAHTLRIEVWDTDSTDDYITITYGTNWHNACAVVWRDDSLILFITSEGMFDIPKLTIPGSYNLTILINGSASPGEQAYQYKDYADGDAWEYRIKLYTVSVTTGILEIRIYNEEGEYQEYRNFKVYTNYTGSWIRQYSDLFELTDITFKVNVTVYDVFDRVLNSTIYNYSRVVEVFVDISNVKVQNLQDYPCHAQWKYNGGTKSEWIPGNDWVPFDLYPGSYNLTIYYASVLANGTTIHNGSYVTYVLTIQTGEDLMLVVNGTLLSDILTNLQGTNSTITGLVINLDGDVTELSGTVDELEADVDRMATNPGGGIPISSIWLFGLVTFIIILIALSVFLFRERFKWKRKAENTNTILSRFR